MLLLFLNDKLSFHWKKKERIKDIKKIHKKRESQATNCRNRFQRRYLFPTSRVLLISLCVRLIIQPKIVWCFVKFHQIAPPLNLSWVNLLWYLSLVKHIKSRPVKFFSSKTISLHLISTPIFSNLIVAKGSKDTKFWTPIMAHGNDP